MRIAMMTNNYKPFVGGVPISIERLADSLRDLGHSVYVFAPDYKSPVDDDEYTFRFPTMKHKIAGAIPIPNLIYGYVKNAISTLDIDLIHVHHPVMIGNVATRIGKEFHIPVVFTPYWQRSIKMDIILETKDLTKTYKAGGNHINAVDHEVMALLKTSAMKYEQTLIVITHNEDIAQMGNRKLVITDGKVVEQ